MKFFTWYRDTEKGQKELVRQAALNRKPWRGFTANPSPSSGKTDWAALWLFVAITGTICFGVGTSIWQVYHYLQYGIWTSVSVIDAFQWAGMKWAQVPTAWLGLHRILDWCPLSLALPSIGIFLAVSANFSD